MLINGQNIFHFFGSKLKELLLWLSVTVKGGGFECSVGAFRVNGREYRNGRE